MRTTLVTGGAGFIGSHLVESLIARGRRVLVVDDLSTGSAENLMLARDTGQLQLYVSSITNEPLMKDLMNEADEIYHLAAVVGVRLVLDEPERTVAVNNEATSMLMHEAASMSKPFFLASTSEVYGKNSKMPLGEEDDCVYGATSRTRWIYACGKALDEHLAIALHRRNGFPVVVGRYFNVSGPRQIGSYGMVLPRFVDQALAGRPLEVHDDGLQRRCFGHVQDVVRATMAIMECPEAVGRVFNIGSDETISIQALAERVVELVNPEAPIQHVPYSRVFGADFEDIRCRVPDLSRIKATIGYQPMFGLDDIIHDLVAWKQGGAYLRALGAAAVS